MIIVYAECKCKPGCESQMLEAAKGILADIGLDILQLLVDALRFEASACGFVRFGRSRLAQ